MADGDLHVVPIGDLLEHQLADGDCRCDPRVELVGARLLFIHNSYDGRETREHERSQADVHYTESGPQ